MHDQMSDATYFKDSCVNFSGDWYLSPNQRPGNYFATKPTFDVEMSGATNNSDCVEVQSPLIHCDQSENANTHAFKQLDRCENAHGLLVPRNPEKAVSKDLTHIASQVKFMVSGSEKCPLLTEATRNTDNKNDDRDNTTCNQKHVCQNDFVLPSSPYRSDCDRKRVLNSDERTGPTIEQIIVKNILRNNAGFFTRHLVLSPTVLIKMKNAGIISDVARKQIIFEEQRNQVPCLLQNLEGHGLDIIRKFLDVLRETGHGWMIHTILETEAVTYDDVTPRHTLREPELPSGKHSRLFAPGWNALAPARLQVGNCRPPSEYNPPHTPPLSLDKLLGCTGWP